jgi:hypothetical protein
MGSRRVTCHPHARSAPHKGILDELKTISLGLVKIVVERIAVVELGMDMEAYYGSDNNGCGFEVDEGSNAV